MAARRHRPPQGTRAGHGTMPGGPDQEPLPLGTSSRRPTHRVAEYPAEVAARGSGGCWQDTWAGGEGPEPTAPRRAAQELSVLPGPGQASRSWGAPCCLGCHRTVRCSLRLSKLTGTGSESPSGPGALWQRVGSSHDLGSGGLEWARAVFPPHRSSLAGQGGLQIQEETRVG